jgi:hypothetical protein
MILTIKICRENPNVGEINQDRSDNPGNFISTIIAFPTMQK